MSKETVSQLREKIEELENQYDHLQEWANEQENTAAELAAEVRELKKERVDLEHFLTLARREGLVSNELDEFVTIYLRYYKV